MAPDKIRLDKRSINNLSKNILSNTHSVGIYLPNIFPLGYFVKRHEPRLLYVMPITMIYNGISYRVKSKNISMNGLQIFMPRTFVQEGQYVEISFDKFIQSQNTLVGGQDQFTPFSGIKYRIKNVEHTVDKTYICLSQVNLESSTMGFLKRFIAGNRLRYKIDASDRICASKAQYYESLYTVNMQHVPMFIHWNNDRGFYIDAIIKTDKNAHFFNYLTHNKEAIDYTPFCLPKRIEKFSELARNNQSAILFSYWENDQFHSVFDFELQNKNELAHITIKVKTCKGRIYKVLSNLNRKPAAEKITFLLSKIQTINTMASRLIDKHASESIAQVIFTDITRFFFLQRFFTQSAQFDSGHIVELSVFSNNQKIRMADNMVLENYDNSAIHIPEIIHFTVDHHRYDSRYHYEMVVSVKFKNKVYSAKTIDFSRSGLGMLINDAIDIATNSLVSITFSGLLIKGISTHLTDIPHRVMVAKRTSQGLFLGVIRNTRDCDNSVNRFFSNLVKRNKDKLELCINDKIDSVKTNFYEAFVTENIQTIPIVISRDREGQHYVREVGLTETPCPLAEKLYIEGHGYDFRFLTTELRLNEFHQRAIRSTESAPQGFIFFLYHEEDKYGKKTIISIADFELKTMDDMEQLIPYILENNGICIQVKFMNNLIIDKLYRNMTLDNVEKLNKASAKLLALEYKEIIGFAEMIDVTDEYQKFYS